MADSTDQRQLRFEARFASLLRHPVCQEIRRILERRPVHIVGGALRDLALGREFRDLDLVIAAGGAAVAEMLAASFGARAIKVGGHRFAAYRVMTQDLPIDIWDRGALSLGADLRRRDFTIHSFALDLHTGALRDPFSGLDDLKNGELRMTSADSFADDPLRILRLCRFASQLVDFHIDPATLDQARESVPDLAGIAKERIRNELEQSLSHSGAATAAQLWIELQVLPEALLQSPLDPPSRQRLLGKLAMAWQALEATAPDLPVDSDLTSARLTLLLCQLGESIDLEINVAIEMLRRQGLVTRARAQQISKLLEAGCLPDSEAQQRWYLHWTGELWPAALSLSAALGIDRTDHAKESVRIRRAIDLASQRPQEIFNPPPLISGEDLQRRLAIQPGPDMGRLLATIRRRQIEGSITSRAEALAAAIRLHAAASEQ